MALLQDELDILNASLVSLGERPMQSEDPGHPAAEWGEDLYRKSVDFVLTIHTFSIGTVRVQLARSADVPNLGYAYKFVSPIRGDIVAIYDSRDADRVIKDFAVFEREVHSDFDTLWADVSVAALPKNWPGYMRALMIEAVAAGITYTLTGDRVLQRDKVAQVFGQDPVFPNGGLMASVKARDSQQQPGARLQLQDNFMTDHREASSWSSQ